MAARTELVPMLDTLVPVISATDLMIFKALFDRSKDWADLEELLRYGRVDGPEVTHWLIDIAGADDPRLARLAAVWELTSLPRPEVVTAELFSRRRPRLGD